MNALDRITVTSSSLALLVSCGAANESIDASGEIDVDGPTGDGPLDRTCGTLPPTCGPTGSSPCCESLLVPGGTFYRSYDGMVFDDMGYPATVSTFRLDKYEVTVGRFREFVNAGMGTQQNPPAAGAGGRRLNGMPNQGGWDPAWNADLAGTTSTLLEIIKVSSLGDSALCTWTDAPGPNESRPMNCIDWWEAMAFCVWDGGFLPTEVETNYAASGGGMQRYFPWSSPPGDMVIDGDHASYQNEDFECVGDGMPGCELTDLVPVGSKPLGDGEWGQSDLSGNVWEWVLDWWVHPYETTTCDDCANLTGPTWWRTMRGGSWVDNRAGQLAARRGSYEVPHARFHNTGVRCARAP